MLLAHGVNLGPFDWFPLWPAIAAVLAVLCVVSVGLAWLGSK